MTYNRRMARTVLELLIWSFFVIGVGVGLFRYSLAGIAVALLSAGFLMNLSCQK
jgi:hypothetical protein